MDLAARLYAWRSHLGFTLNQVVERTKFAVSQGTLTKAEQGDTSMRWKVLEVIIKEGLGLTVLAFFGDLPKVAAKKPTKVQRARAAA